MDKKQNNLIIRLKCFLKIFLTLSQADIKTAIEAGIIMNLDNEHEAEMVDELLKNQCKDFQPNIIGMRYSSSFLRVPQKFDEIIKMRLKTMFNLFCHVGSILWLEVVSMLFCQLQPNCLNLDFL